ncbi:GRIP1-associated protein 1 isoform X2 [Alligator mississippiensis]|uniref:GRIP1-associated protein 1 isoform B n=1 Tax=Alligator mississippiensis TaxID=8496 RepID=A0A151M7E3_ALLMI|nr:GRIP1-associated protein 1 isoform X2 [Alligator mississippiensis]KYO20419.1 GRIP1-associated protein 1 isoform B [Alligator mississippiensis]
MAQALSEDEFQRMQGQLLELRTQNYQLSDELRKNGTELHGLRQRVTFLDKELSKAQKALSKSKKAQEVEALLSETEMLQGKLHSQEDDFRLQSSTLLAELSKLCSQIEGLEQENARLREGAPAPPPAPPGPELLRLQAENTALRHVAALQDAGSWGTGGCGDGPPGAGEGPGDPSQGPPPPGLAELELSWETEKEEKRLLQEQLQCTQESHQAEVSRLQEEVNKLTEKLKKKQESFLRLQAEKEALYNDSRMKLAELGQRQDEELRGLQLRNQRLQQELEAATQSCTEAQEQIQLRSQEHEVAVQALQEQAASQSAETQEQVETILTENEALRTSLAALEQIQSSRTQELNLLREQALALGQELQQRRGQQETLSIQCDDLASQLQESVKANEQLLEQLQELGEEKQRLLLELDETRKTAEKRKGLLDELAIEGQRERGRHQEALEGLRLQQEKAVLGLRARYERELRELHEEKKRHEDELRGQLRDEKARSRELETVQQTAEELQLQIQAMDGTKGWFERRLKEAEELMEKQQAEHKEALRLCKEQHVAELEQKDKAMEATRAELREAEQAQEEQDQVIQHLKQEVKDMMDGQRILEKKGSAALKDLKRQLQLERKRADKLQERLQDVLTNSKARPGLEELVLAEMSSPSRTTMGDSSSISSFSYRDIMKEGSGPGSTKSNTGSPQSQAPRAAELSEDEAAELFQRLAETQQQKWLLEEKVKHLEVSSASMAEDLCRKSTIIETYVMDSRIDVSRAPDGAGPERRLGAALRELVRPGADENLREMNKKLQNLLEEQLTKNLHLSQDLEVLSQELVRLSKGPSPTPDPPE